MPPNTVNRAPIDIDDAVIRADAAAYVSAALRRIGMRRPAQQAKVLCPPMHRVISRMAYFVTDTPASAFTSKPILDSALEAGLIAFFSTSDPASDGPTSFFQAAVSRLTELLSMQIHCGDVAWNPTGCTPLGELSAAGQSLQVDHAAAPHLVSHAEFRRHVLRMVASPAELRRLNANPDHAIHSPR